MDTIVISLGGSVLFSEDGNAPYIKDLAKLLHRLSTSIEFALVIGGGTIARGYIKRGRSLGLSEIQLDQIGIAITRINAQFFSFFLPHKNMPIPLTTDEATALSDSIVVMGGTTPGHSTDMVGAELAVKTKALRFIIATNVDGIYDKDPRKFSQAQQLPTVHIDELLDTYGDGWDAAGKNTVVDGPALRIIKDHRLDTRVVNGFKLIELEKAIVGKAFHGTQILV
ncbi:MAG: UMP kinase [Candidatus Thermoplasmatota archaeon]|nr:UMP kinase [Candidatus Thermoplasmatota archaeon]MBU1940733.1 UMP kinase [Candidatus Thermoplasmatota archaeon]